MPPCSIQNLSQNHAYNYIINFGVSLLAYSQHLISLIFFTLIFPLFTYSTTSKFILKFPIRQVVLQFIIKSSGAIYITSTTEMKIEYICALFETLIFALNSPNPAPGFLCVIFSFESVVVVGHVSRCMAVPRQPLKAKIIWIFQVFGSDLKKRASMKLTWVSPHIILLKMTLIRIL